MLNGCRRVHALKALTALSKFLGVCEDFKKLVRNYGLKCTARSSDELIIDRLTKVTDPDEMFRWIREVKAHLPRLAGFMDLLAVTGLRLVEAVECNNLIIDLAGQGKLGEYYKAEGLLHALQCNYDTFSKEVRQIGDYAMKAAKKSKPK